jgi:vacuolar-type H+-ATPase subunit I/STV1
MNNYKSEVMKSAVIILVFLLLYPVMELSAQNQNFERFNTYKIGFFTKKLNLSSAEAEKFWPVYNEYQNQKTRLQVEKGITIRTFNQNESTLSDKEITALGDKLIAIISEESALAVTLHKKLKEVLPPAKVIRFYQAENQYKQQLLNELQGKQQQRQPPRGDL